MWKSFLKFYDLKIYGKTLVQCVKKALHVQHWHETIQNLTLNVACRFLDFVRIIRDLIVKRYLSVSLTLPMNIFIIILAAFQ